MQKNATGQKWIVFAYDSTTGLPKTGDAANITANIRLDGGAANPVDDVNPTELDTGYYVFDISQVETNANLLSIHPVSVTANIVVIGVPGATWTVDISALALEATLGGVKAKTDNLPSDPADQSLVEAAITAKPSAVFITIP